MIELLLCFWSCWSQSIQSLSILLMLLFINHADPFLLRSNLIPCCRRVVIDLYYVQIYVVLLLRLVLSLSPLFLILTHQQSPEAQRDSSYIYNLVALVCLYSRRLWFDEYFKWKIESCVRSLLTEIDVDVYPKAGRKVLSLQSNILPNKAQFCGSSASLIPNKLSARNRSMCTRVITADRVFESFESLPNGGYVGHWTQLSLFGVIQ